MTTVPTPHLDNRHSVFGEVVKGQEVIVAIGNAPRGPGDRPQKDVVLQEVVISREKK
ncbi:MAG: peptidylprolyl isomerase [candidate division NC10 bacterium]